MSPNPPPPEPRGQETRQQRPHTPREHPTARCRTQALWIAGSYTVFTRSSTEASARPPIRRKHPMHPERTAARPAGSEKRCANSLELPSKQCRPTHPRRSRVDRKSANKDPIHPENTPPPGAERRRFGLLGVTRCSHGVPRSQALACQSALNSFQGTASKNFQFVSLISIVFCVA